MKSSKVLMPYIAIGLTLFFIGIFLSDISKEDKKCLNKKSIILKNNKEFVLPDSVKNVEYKDNKIIIYTK